MPRAAARMIAFVTATTVLGSGCAGLVEAPRIVAVDLERPEMRQFEVARAMTTLERDSRIETGGSDRSRELTPKLFWSGIAIGSLGAVGTIGFAIAGRVAKDDLNAMYEAGSGTLEERNRIRARGEAWNAMVVTSAALVAAGFALALITYGVDWNRCGPLAEKKRKCKALGLAR